MSKYAIGHIAMRPTLPDSAITVNQNKMVTYREKIPATHELIPRGRLSLIKLFHERSKVAILYIA